MIAGSATGVGVGAGVACGRASPVTGPATTNASAPDAKAAASTLVRNERNDFRVAELRTALQRRQLYEERVGFDVRAESLQEPSGGGRRAAGREQIVDDQHAFVGSQCIGMNFKRIRAVLQRVVFYELLVRKFSAPWADKKTKAPASIPKNARRADILTS